MYNAMVRCVEDGHMFMVDPFNEVMVWYVHPQTGEESLVDRLPHDCNVVWHENVDERTPKDVRVLYEDDPCIRMKYVANFTKVSTKAHKGVVQVVCRVSFDAESQRMVGVIEKVCLMKGPGAAIDEAVIEHVKEAFVKMLTDKTMGEKVFLAQVDDLKHEGRVYKLL